MKTNYFYLLQFSFALSLATILLSASSCEKDNGSTTVSIGAELCLVTQHHERGLPGITVYLKYNAIEFPGYDDLSVFDDSIVSNELAEACFPKTPPGKHWCVAYGTDSLLNEPVRGSVPIELFNYTQPRDTVLYVSEY